MVRELRLASERSSTSLHLRTKTSDTSALRHVQIREVAIEIEAARTLLILVIERMLMMNSVIQRWLNLQRSRRTCLLEPN